MKRSFEREISPDAGKFHGARCKLHQALKQLYEQRTPLSWERLVLAQKEFEDTAMQNLDNKREELGKWQDRAAERATRLVKLNARITKARKALDGTLEGDERRQREYQRAAAEQRAARSTSEEELEGQGSVEPEVQHY